MNCSSHGDISLDYSFRKARSELQFAARELGLPGDWDVNYNYTTRVPLRNSGMYEVLPKHAKIVIGLRDLRSSCRMFSNVDDAVFLSTLAFLNHEHRHVEQVNLFYSSRDLALADMATSFIATRGNNDFYSLNHALFNFEADANLHGLTGVERYLHDGFPHVGSEELDSFIVSAYKNGVLLNDVTQWMPPDVISSLESFGAVYDNCKSMLGYSKTFRKQIAVDENNAFILKNGRMDKDAEAQALSKSLDEFAIAIGRSDTGHDWRPILDRYLSEDTGSGVDKMLACVHLYLYPDIKKDMPILYRMDLSPEKVFGMPFPESAHSIRHRIRSLVGDKNFQNGRAIGAESGRDMTDLNRIAEDIEAQDFGDDGFLTELY